MTEEILELSKILWDYHHLNHILEKSDIIMVLGSQDIRVAKRGVELYKQGLADKILFSGGIGRLTQADKKFQGTTEADRFAEIAIESGIPKEKIIIENKSTNTGENIIFSAALIKDLGITSIIIVQKPYMERRTFATFSKQRPGAKVEFYIASPQVSFKKYPNENISLETLINMMVGDMQRIIEYPAKGFQIYQEIPENVMIAYNKLIAFGFTKNLAK
ncbi:MAG: YdcF family protein [candidate division SR1 bacterium]|nr:YdcF family protein [candidate division SR1 bacterium]